MSDEWWPDHGSRSPCECYKCERESKHYKLVGNLAASLPRASEEVESDISRMVAENTRGGATKLAPKSQLRAAKERIEDLEKDLGLERTSHKDTEDHLVLAGKTIERLRAELAAEKVENARMKAVLAEDGPPDAVGQQVYRRLAWKCMEGRDAAEARAQKAEADLADHRKRIWMPLSVREGTKSPEDWYLQGQEFIKALQERALSATAALDTMAREHLEEIENIRAEAIEECAKVLEAMHVHSKYYLRRNEAIHAIRALLDKNGDG
jgi:hypothetical protein